MTYAPVPADPGNPCLASISEPSTGTNKVDVTAQNIRKSVQAFRATLQTNLNPTPPTGGTGWSSSVRIVRHSGSNKTKGTATHAGTYTAISTLPPKQPSVPVDQNALIIKRAMLHFSKFLIDQEQKAGNLDGNWRAIVRIVPKDSAGPNASIGCGCGCS